MAAYERPRSSREKRDSRANGETARLTLDLIRIGSTPVRPYILTLYFKVSEFDAEVKLPSLYDRQFISYVQRAWVDDGKLELGEKEEVGLAVNLQGADEPRKWTVGEGEFSVWCPASG